MVGLHATVEYSRRRTHSHAHIARHGKGMFALFVKNRHINKMELTYTPIEGDGPEVVRGHLRFVHTNITDILSLVHLYLHCEVSLRWPACHKRHLHYNHCLPGFWPHYEASG